MKKFDSINVVPFIDIMLVLLAIVLATSTFVAKGIIPLQLPKSTAKQAKHLKYLNISIQKDGTIFFDKEKMTKDELFVKLSMLPKKTSVAIRGDKNSKFQTFVTVLEMLKNMNFKNISIITKK